jgi:hypothetical protein
MEIASLFARLGFKVDNQKLTGFKAVLQNVVAGMAVAAAGAAAFTAAVKALTDAQFEAAAAMVQFESETGSSAEELQKWQQIAEMTNNSAESMTAAFKTLSEQREKIKLGQGNLSGYQMLGIDPNQPPEEILEDLRVKLKGLPPAMQKVQLSQMGLSPELLQVLALSNEEFEKMASKTFIIPKSAIMSMDAARAAIQEVGVAVNWLKAMIAAELAPGIEELNKEIAQWIRNNKEGILKGIKNIVKWITSFTKAVMNAGKMINSLITYTIGWKNAMIGLIAIIAMLNSALLFSPIGLIVAGIILLVAVLDDLYVYSQGKGKSLFGVLMEQFPEIEDMLKDFLSVIKESVGLIKALFTGDEAGIEEFIKRLGGLGVAIVKIFETIKTTFAFAFLAIKAMLWPIQDLIDMISELWKAFKGEAKWGEVLKNITGKMQQRSQERTGDYKQFGETFKSSVESIQNAYNINMEVNTNGDAKETSELVNQQLQEYINSASNQRGRDQ